MCIVVVIESVIDCVEKTMEWNVRSIGAIVGIVCVFVVLSARIEVNAQAIEIGLKRDFGIVTAPNSRQFNLTFSWSAFQEGSTTTPDCVYRDPLVLVNGQFPPPTLSLKAGEEIELVTHSETLSVGTYLALMHTLTF